MLEVAVLKEVSIALPDMFTELMFDLTDDLDKAGDVMFARVAPVGLEGVLQSTDAMDRAGPLWMDLMDATDSAAVLLVDFMDATDLFGVLGAAPTRSIVALVLSSVTLE